MAVEVSNCACDLQSLSEVICLKPRWFTRGHRHAWLRCQSPAPLTVRDGRDNCPLHLSSHLGCKLRINVPICRFYNFPIRNQILHGYVNSYFQTRSQLSVSKATRWDNYLHIFDPRIHWFSIVNSIVIVLFLCVMVAIILLRTVSRDVSTYLPKQNNLTYPICRFPVTTQSISA